jgi:hypothetical protein
MEGEDGAGDEEEVEAEAVEEAEDEAEDASAYMSLSPPGGAGVLKYSSALCNMNNHLFSSLNTTQRMTNTGGKCYSKRRKMKKKGQTI